MFSGDMLRAITPLPLVSVQNQLSVPTPSVERASNSLSMGRISHVQSSTAESHHVAETEEKMNVQKLQRFSEYHSQQNGTLVSGDMRKLTLNQMQVSKSEVFEDVMAPTVKQEVSISVQPQANKDIEMDIKAAVAVHTEPMTVSDTVEIYKALDNTFLNAAKSTSSVSPNQNLQKGAHIVQRYRGPLFDSPANAKRFDGLTSHSNAACWGSSVSLEYDVRKLLLEEGVRIIGRKRARKLKLLDSLLSTGFQGYHVRPDEKLRLRIEQRKLSLMDLQSRIREEVEQHQQEIMAMGERDYRKFVRLCERQRAELTRQALVLQKMGREKQLRSLFQWRKKLLEAQWACRDARISRNRGVAKYHEKMLREFSKRKDEDRTKRMEALKNNDVDAYREMLRQQQTEMPGDAGARFEVLSSFLTQTEEYLHKLGGKISAVKTQQEKDEAVVAAAAAARAQGLSEEEIEEAAMEAEEALSSKIWSYEDQLSTTAPVNKYYSLAHAIDEQILKQPSMLRAGILRDYQLVGLQWMLSLYNNRLNGILADEMGLGKTVQVMALIAYLMEFKGNYGPHLIIVPNAVIVNWKSELLRWLPSVSCIFYVGVKDQRSKIYSQDVAAMKFNILVTTYEFIMRDRAKLSKVDWKYMIIDEAQRMKDRDSRLARDLDRFRCQRRLLLTGTPLQNDLHELWSLLNLLLPEVFDSSKVFHDWFSKPFQKEGTVTQTAEDDWLETEKKVIVIHRLHQILEPFMLRRRVEDVEGSLPPKVPIVLKCKMSALQAAIYDWVKTTGTIRLDPEDEAQRVAGANGNRQVRAYVPLQNKCMELRKVCNHPFLNYPPYGHYLDDNIVRFCGKLWMLDRILLKLHRTGHKVLLFSTMTRLLDILEEYLQWRGLIYRRIDGTTNLDARETAIVDFNEPDSECFIFLLSIRAAGRGLNLQTADTVVIYDPDPNPKNEEQAVARAHRIGQKREVRVIYLEAVVETISSYQKEDELRSGGNIDIDDEMAGKDRYMGSVESLVRNNIQQHKIDMADEVINAGRFDQRTTQEERRLTLEALLHDEERYQETVHDVPSMQEVNRLIARTEEEIEIFDQMDEDWEWPGEMLKHHEVPAWLRVGSHEVNAAIAATSKQALKKGVIGLVGTREAEEKLVVAEASARSEISDNEKCLSINLKTGKVGDDAEGEAERVSKDDFDEVIAEEEDFLSGEEGEIREGFEDDEEGEIREAIEEEDDPAGEEMRQDESEDDQKQEVEEEVIEVIEEMEEIVDDIDDKVADSEDQEVQEEVSFDSDDGDDESRGTQDADESQLPVLKKFGSLAALESRSAKQERVESLGGEELEEGEIAASGNSPLDTQPSSHSMPEQDDIDDQVIQPQKKRKRSMRHPRKISIDGLAEKNTDDDSDRDSYPANSLQPTTWQDYDGQRLVQRVDRRPDNAVDHQVEWSDSWPSNSCHGPYFHAPYSDRPHENYTNWHPWFGLPHTRLSGYQEQSSNVCDSGYRESRSLKLPHTTGFGSFGGARMPESVQKKCKAVLSKLQGAVNRDGHQIAAKLMELPKHGELPDYYRVIDKPIDARTIEEHLVRFEYATVLDFAGDVQLMLDNAARYDSDLQADARRLQGLFFERMSLMFPDVDFNSVRISIGVAVQPSQWSRSLRKGESGSKLPRSSVQASDKQMCLDVDKDSRHKVKSKKQGKTNRPKPTEKASARDVEDLKEANVVVLHPVDLIIHRKKRNSRRRSEIRKVSDRTNKRTQSSSQKSKHANDYDGNFSLSKLQGGRGALVTTGRVETCTIKVVGDGILNPRKKMRTDIGRRRPAHN
ncbi:hypothetical protein O6H91_04G145700 [Diphasiastrum complanatum]|nr:hypothetical protein O6H91_04G145700 [Diphasiastrum complanatum]